MNVLSLVLFLHVLGVLGFFIAIGFDGMSLFRLRRSMRGQDVGPWLGLSAEVPRMYRASLALVVVSGAYLTRGVLQGLTPSARMSELGWLVTSLAALTAFGVVAGLSLRRMRPFWGAAPSGTDAAAIRLERLRDPLLPTLFVIRATLAVATVFLMISRPSLNASVGAAAVAVVFALAVSGLAWRREPLSKTAS